MNLDQDIKVIQNSFWYTNKVSTIFLSKVSIYKFWKQAWPKMGVAMILTVAAQAHNVGIGENSRLVISDRVKSFMARSATKCKINTVWLPTTPNTMYPVYFIRNALYKEQASNKK